jgi:hypothetical protein
LTHQKEKKNQVTVVMSLSTKIKTPAITYDQPTGLYIDGKWAKGTEGKTFDSINPTTEEVIVAVHEAGPEGEHPLTLPISALKRSD